MNARPGQGMVSVIIPVYNGSRTLGELLERLSQVLPQAAERFEVICVNDDSRDDSWQTITGLARRWPWLRGLDLMRNYGQHNALLAGIRAAQGAILVTMDDDLQHPPEEVPRLLAALEDGVDLVYGAPQAGGQRAWRAAASWLTRAALASALGVRTARHVSAFRAFRASLREPFLHHGSPWVSVDVVLAWGTTRITAVPVAHAPRRQGASNYSLRSLVVHALTMVAGFSTWPLRLASVVGFGATLFGLAVLGYVVVRFFLVGGAPPGFPFLASLIAIFSGAQLFALGIMGEYLARMHFRMMDRPAYLIRAGTP
jgi:undecaprenyl-phosphate 4-deoxy-4-formamido-L-arabinose transferase